MSEFKGNAGTIYTSSPSYTIESTSPVRWEVWFEDFCIIGQGGTELEALRDAERITSGMNALVKKAVTETEARSAVSTTAGTGD